MRRAAGAVDLVAVVLFVVIGRASHHHAETSRGFMSTGWPFAIGLASGWLAVKRRRPLPLLTGLVVCLATVAVGMALRVVAGQGTAVAFVAVGLLFLGSIMIGGRLLLAAWTTSSRRPSGPALRGGAGDR